MSEDFGREIAESVERARRRANPVYDAEKTAEELGRWREEHRAELEAARYERLSSKQQRELAERRAVLERAREIEAELGVLFGPFGLRLGSPVPERTVEELKRHLRARLEVPATDLEVVLDGVVARIEAGDGRGARRLVADACERWAAAGGGARPEASEEELDPRKLAEAIPRR